MLIPIAVRMTKVPGSVPDFGPTSPLSPRLTLATRYATGAAGTSDTRGTRIRVNTFDGGTDGVLISAANSGGASGNALSPNSSKAIFSAVQAVSGLLSAEWNYTGTGSLGQQAWTGLGSNPRMYGSFWLRYVAAPSATIRHVYMTTSGFANSAFLAITSAGKVQWQDASQAAIAASLSTTVLAADTWYRIDWAVDFPHSTLYWSLYDATGVVIESNISTGTIGGDAGDVRYGPDTFAALTYRFWMDDVTAGTFTNAVGTATSHQYSGTAAGTSDTSATATGTATSHQYSGTAAGTSATSSTATGVATSHQYAGTATGTSPTSATASGLATPHQYSGTAAGTSATTATATGAASAHQYDGTADATSSTSATASGHDYRSGTASATSATSATAAGTATTHQYQGTATATSATSATASGTATHHQYSGTAEATSATSATADGTALHHQYAGTATGTTATSATATGAAAAHAYQGAAAAESATSATATGSATPHLTLATAEATSPTSATAAGSGIHHDYEGTAEATSSTPAAAVGTATRHQYQGVATATSATSASATGTPASHQYSGTGDATSATSALAAGTATATPSVVSGRAGGEPWRYHDVHYPVYATAIGKSNTWARAYGAAKRGRRQREGDDMDMLRLLDLVG